MLTHIELPFGSKISDSFKSIYRCFHIFNCRQLFRTSGRKAAQYELTSPIFYMEQYIPFSRIICEPFSRILEILL